MKQIASGYTYNKTSGVILLTGVNIDRDQLLLIVNTTRNVTYYNFADSATTLQSFTQGANTSVTLASSVVSASSTHTNADALIIYYDNQVNANIISGNVNALSVQNANFTSGGGIDGPPLQSVALGFEDIENGGFVQVNSLNKFPISGTVTSLAGGETPTSGTATLTTDTRYEINTEGFGHIAFEIVSSGVTWTSNGVVAQAYNGTAPGNADILAPAGIRYRHSSDTSVAPTTALNNIY